MIRPLRGQSTTGGVASRMVIVKQHCSRLLPALNVQQFVVTPGGNRLPLGCTQVTGSVTPVQVLVAWASKNAAVPAAFVQGRATSGGHTIRQQSCVVGQRTTTSKQHCVTFWKTPPSAICKSQQTRLVPTGKKEPEGGAHTTRLKKQLFVPITLKATSAPWGDRQSATTLLGHSSRLKQFCPCIAVAVRTNPRPSAIMRMEFIEMTLARRVPSHD
jgi:hypothetical protein